MTIANFITCVVRVKSYFKSTECSRSSGRSLECGKCIKLTLPTSHDLTAIERECSIAN